MEVLHALIQKNAVEKVKTQMSPAFFNRLFLVPKCNNKWRPILDLRSLNEYLKSREIQNGDTREHKDFLAERRMGNVHRFQGYFYISINPQSRKYLRFHIQGQSNQYKALLFSLSTILMEFTMLVKDVKLMAHNQSMRMHQYLDDWLVRATFHQACLQHTMTLVALCQDLG